MSRVVEALPWEAALRLARSARTVVAYNCLIGSTAEAWRWSPGQKSQPTAWPMAAQVLISMRPGG